MTGYSSGSMRRVTMEELGQRVQAYVVSMLIGVLLGRLNVTILLQLESQPSSGLSLATNSSGQIVWKL
jgi:hypothetical protein